MNTKRIILAIIFVAAVISIAVTLYFVFFRKFLGLEQGSTGNVNSNGTLPSILNGNVSVVDNANRNAGLPDFLRNIDLTTPSDVARGGLTNVKDYGNDPVSGLSVGKKGKLFYDAASGLFVKLDGDKATPLSDKRFAEVKEITWSQQQDKAILEYPDGSNIIFDFENNKQVTLPKEMTDFSFDSTGDQIAGKWIGRNRDENWLMIGSSNGADLRLIEPIGDRGHNVNVDFSPDNQVVAVVRSAADATTQTVLPIGQKGENFKSFTVDGLNFESKWAPEGSKLLYSASGSDGGYAPRLWLTSGETQSLGKNHLDLQLSTWVDKCSFNASGTQLYCAEPTELPRAAGLYPELATGIPDVFYRIDLRTGQKIPLAFPVGDRPFYSAASVHLSDDESELLFVDAITKRLHSIRLK